MTAQKPWYEDDHLWTTMGDILFDHHRWDAAVKDVDNMVKLLELQSGDHVLDLCCGVGRHSLDFARRGCKVTGVDRTAHYLEIAADKAAWEGLQIEFVREDMRRFCRPDSFDLAISMFTSFGYFENLEDERAVAGNIYRSLKPGGRLVIDLIGKEVLARIFQARDWIEQDDLIVLEERTPSSDWDYMTSRWIVIRNGVKEEFSVKLRMFSACELTALLKSAGFGYVDVFGDLDGSPYDHTAKRLVSVARK